jgi:hypothetical protein
MATVFETIFMKPFLIFLLLFSTVSAQAKTQSNIDTAHSNSVVFHEDARIAQILTLPSPRYTGKARGFRIQIYNGLDRDKANRIKLDFMQRHPGVGAYLTYTKPHFRVRIGNFRTRAAATSLYRELSEKYTCMIVPEIIYIPPPQNN